MQSGRLGKQIVVACFFCSIYFQSVSANLSCSKYATFSTTGTSAKFIFGNASKITQQPSDISGGMSLKGNLALYGNLTLENSVNFEFNNQVGSINGNDYSIILNSDLIVPANNILHITGNMLLNGSNLNIKLNDNAQLFIDDNVTLTLSNVTVKSSKNGVGNPAIKLASNRSKLVLDNSKLDFANDFYFDRGQLFAYNDVNFSGTNAFIYRSTVPSYIKSGANLKFNTGTSFDFRPSTTGTPEMLAKDLLIFDDSDSKISFDGSTLKATLTGMRLSSGQILFDNKVSLTSQSQFSLISTGSWFGRYYSGWINVVKFSPDGRTLAVGASSGNLFLYRVTNSSLVPITSFNYGSELNSIDWSPDGKYFAIAGYAPVSGNEVEVYKFVNSSVSLVASIYYGDSTHAVCWSPDGKYLAVGSYTTPGHEELEVYSFDGITLTRVVSQNYGALVRSISWSSDGIHLAIGGTFPTTGHDEIEVYRFNGVSLSLVTSQNYGSHAWYVSWSPDGRYLAVGGQSPSSGDELQVFSFTGSSLILLASLSYGSSSSFIDSVSWSPDGRYFAIAGYSSSGYDPVAIYKLVDDSSLSLVASVDCGFAAYFVDWSVDGNRLAVGGDTPTADHNVIELYTLQYGPETQTQAISNSIVFGNSVAGSPSDLNVKLLSGANVSVDGILNYDNVNSTSIFSNDNARFVLKDSNSTIRLNPNTVVGWQDRSLIKNLTGVGLGDYNLKTYDTNANTLVSYAEAPGELVYDNSNAIVKLSLQGSALPTQNSNAIKYLSDHFISVNNGKVTVLGGITGSTNVAGRGLLSSPIDLQGGTLTLNSDMILSNQTTVVSSGNFDLQGNAMIFGGDLTLPSNVAIKIISSGVLDGQGSEFRNAIGAKLIVDNNVSLTLRNMNWAAAGTPQIEMRTGTSKLTLQNLSTSFDRDYSFTQGQLFIQDDVFVTGTNKFSYVSTATSYVMPHSTLLFDKNTTFSYSPRQSSRHTRSERNLIKLLNKTSEIYFNECTLQLPDSGWQLTNGTIYFDNKVNVYGNTTQADSFEWGNGTVEGDLDVNVLAGALIDDHGYIYHNSGN